MDLTNYPNNTGGQFLLPKYYRYVYALFSASGFSSNATRMALAHQISLIDLGGSEFNELRRDVRSVANVLVHSNYANRDLFVNNIRNAMRHKLSIWPNEVERDIENTDNTLIGLLEPLINTTLSYGELFVAMTKGPFMLVLKADNPRMFIEYSNEFQKHKITIKRNTNLGQERIWYVYPMNNPTAYRLTFAIPQILGDWIFRDVNRIKRNALLIRRYSF